MRDEKAKILRKKILIGCLILAIIRLVLFGMTPYTLVANIILETCIVLMLVVALILDVVLKDYMGFVYDLAPTILFFVSLIRLYSRL